MRSLPLVSAAPDIRWECRSCGACCRGPDGVVVTEAEAARIEEIDWTATWPDLGGRLVVTRLVDEATGAVERRIKRVPDAAQPGGGMRCVFLDAKKRCRIQERLGWAAKPLACRLFPLTVVEDPDGALEVVATAACLSLHETFEEGRAVAAMPALAELAAAAPRRATLRGEAVVLAPAGAKEPPKTIAPIDARALLDDVISAVRAARTFDAIPWRVAWPVKRALGGAPPGYAYEGPPEMPFYDALRAAREHLAPRAIALGAARLAAGFEALGKWEGFRKVARSLEPACDRFVRELAVSWMREYRPLDLPDLVNGIGADLYVAFGVAAAASRMGEVLRQGGKATAKDANDVAAEAIRFLDAPEARRYLALCREALARMLFDAPKPEG